MGKPDKGQRGGANVRPDPGLDIRYHLCLSLSAHCRPLFVPLYSADALVTHPSEIVRIMCVKCYSQTKGLEKSKMLTKKLSSLFLL